MQIAGAALVLAAFVLAQRRLLDQESLAYLVPNAVGSSVLAVDAALGAQWGFLFLEGAWAFVSLAGTRKAAMRRPPSSRRGPRPPSRGRRSTS